ncbi:unnamed protein product [Lampetra fluviatilis]
MAVARGRRGYHVGGGDITACGGGPPRDQTRGVGDTKRGCSARDPRPGDHARVTPTSAAFGDGGPNRLSRLLGLPGR